MASEKLTWNEYLHGLVAKPRMGRRIFALLVSVFLMGVCVTVLNWVHFGSDPCSCMCLGIAHTIGMSYGNWLAIFNCIMVIAVIILDPRMIGFGSLANMFLVGYSADFASWLLNLLLPNVQPAGLDRWLIFLPTLLVFLVVVAFYLVVDLGAAPYDAIPSILARRIPRVPYRVIRVIWDVTAVIIAFFVGGEVGIATILTGFFLGPIISWIAGKFGRLFE